MATALLRGRKAMSGRLVGGPPGSTRSMAWRVVRGRVIRAVGAGYSPTATRAVPLGRASA